MSMFLREAAEVLHVDPTEEATFDAVLLNLRKEGVPVPNMGTTEEKRNYLLKLIRRGHPLPEGVVQHLRSLQPAW